jgi:hypothetical protein
MQLEDEDIREFRALWEAEFGETLSDGEARHRASQLLALYECLVRPPRRAESPPSRPPA